MWVGFLGGLSVTAVGVWAVVSAKHGNPFENRIRQLALEQHALERQLAEVRRDRERRARFDLSPDLSFGAGPRVSLLLNVRL